MDKVVELLAVLADSGVRLTVDGDQLNCYAPKGALTQDQKIAIQLHKTELVTFLKMRRLDVISDSSSRKINVRTEDWPLAVGAQALVVLQELEPDSSAYNIPLCLKIIGAINLPLFEMAWDSVLDQYPILMARVDENRGVPILRVDAGRRVKLRCTRLDVEDDSTILSRARSSAKLPFDLRRGPLVRIELFQRDETNAFLLVTAHHIIFDGASGVLLLKTLLNNYRRMLAGGFVQPKEISHGYADFAAWERDMLASPESQDDAKYWQSRLADFPSKFQLVQGNRPDAIGSAGDGSTFTEELGGELSESLRAIAVKTGVTLSSVLLAVFVILLKKYSGESDFVIGMPVSLRTQKQHATDIGFFVNMVPLRIECKDDCPFLQYLKNVQYTMIDALYHSSYPIDGAADIRFGLKSSDARAARHGGGAIFQVSYAYQDFLNSDEFSRRHDEMGPEIEYISSIGQEGDSDLSLQVFSDGPDVVLQLSYDPAVYARDIIARFFSQYSQMLRAVIQDPALSNGEFDCLSPQEKQRVLIDFNRTRVDHPSAKCIHELFAEQAERHPSRIALQFGEGSMSYQELNERSLRVASCLQSQGVGPNSIVGLCVERSFEMVTGLLGILQAGGVFLPLDPEYPADRLAYMLQNSGAELVLTQERLASVFSKDCMEKTRFLMLDGLRSPLIHDDSLRSRKEAAPLKSVRPGDPAYIIYTSGSTGQPKGVLVDHASLVNHNYYVRRQYRIDADDVQIQFSSMSFDLFMEEVFSILNSGAKLVIAPKDEVLSLSRIETLISQFSVSLLNVPTAFFHELSGSGIDFPSLKCIIVGGEKLDYTKAITFLEQYPDIALQNTYGPTETTIISTAVSVTFDLLAGRDFVPIGTPIDNTQIYILDSNRNLQAVGVPGELYIAGHGLARGYLNRSDLTQERFVENPFECGKRMYRTGDLARWLDDGNIEYLGRIDTQVKIRGFRIELGEIEALLNRHPLIESAVVVARGEQTNKQLIAFYRLKESGQAPDAIILQQQLKSHLQQTLPGYMIPSGFQHLEKMPLTPGGKVDRLSLETLDVQIFSSRAYVAARTQVEQQLVDIWAQVLQLAPHTIGIHDNFFELGGHSLLAMQVVSRIRTLFSVDLPLKTFFGHSSIVGIGASILEAERSKIPEIRAVVREPFLPLSFSQERLWFIHQLDPDSPGYNVAGAVRIRTAIDVSRLEGAFIQIAGRHESLRTTFAVHEGQPYQRISDELDFRPARMDFSDMDAGSREHRARLQLQTEALTPFDLEQGPLLRSLIVKLADDDHLLMVNMHHIISDGWSIGILIRELGSVLNGMDSSLLPLPIQYADYSVWQRRWLDESGILKQQLTYWQEKLAGVPEMMALATDYPRPNMQSATGATRTFSINRELTEQLGALADNHGCTLYMVVLAAVKTLMYRYTGQEDVCIGTPIANRQYEETQVLIGMFVNTLALRTAVAPEGAFADILASVRRTCLEAYENQDAPFEKVVEAMRLRRNMAVSPLFQVMVSLENADSENSVEGVENYPLESRISKFDLSFDFTKVADGMTGAIEYSTVLYRAERIERMVDHLLSILGAVVSAPETKIKDIDFLRNERKRLLFGLNDTCAPYPKDKCIHDLFAEQVALYPHRTAVQIGKRMLSYRELNQWSLDIAFHLQSHGVGPNAIVGLCVERSLEMVAGLLGILQSGGVFLPLDPDYPPERLAYMLQDSGTRLVLTQEKFMALLQAVATSEAELVVLDGAHSPVERDVPELGSDGAGLQRKVSAEDPAYVIYTSGSTGQPKGVLVEHSGLVNHNTYARTQYRIDADDIQVQFSSMSFDLFMEEVFSVLNSGAKLILAPKDDVLSLQGLESLIDDHLISILNVPTAFFHELAASGIRLSCLKCVIVGGERLDYAKASTFVERYPAVTLHNTYGPTEATIISTAVAVTPDLLAERDFVPIGKPIDNTQIYILDANRNLLPIGIPGELHIAGDGLARGYLNRPELTLERFVENPFVPGSRMYRTGDMARWLEDGNIEYLGRIDTQVKIRGFRIELGEIEALLNQHPQIDDAVVIARGELANKQLIAFYRLKQNSIDPGTQPTQDELKAHLQNALPSFMIPAGFICLEKIPLTPNGKVDRSALENSDVQLASGRGYVAARTPTERQLVDIWAQVLQIPSQTIGVNDNFFDLGGHSLLAVRIMARTKDCFGRLIPLAALFSAPTIAEFAQLISDRGEQASDIVVQIQSGNGGAPLFAVPGAGGNVLSFRALSEAIGSDQPFFALQAVGLDGKTPPIESVEATAAVNVEAMRAIQSNGPYRLVGHSYGGVVAFEMARLLIEQGEEVDRLVLLDAIAPHVMQAQDAIDRAMDLSGLCVALAEQSGMRLKVSADELQGLTIDELADILAENELEVGREQLDILYRVFSANLRCYERYRPAKLQHDIDVRLYRAMEQGGQAEQWPRDYGWSQILQQPPSIADMDATHFSMLQEPRVRAVADHLRHAVVV